MLILQGRTNSVYYYANTCIAFNGENRFAPEGYF